MIGKVLLASAALVGSVGLMVPIAIAGGGNTDACGSIQPTPAGTTSPGTTLPDAEPSSAEVLRGQRQSTVPGAEMRGAATPTAGEQPAESAGAEPTNCPAPVGSGGHLPGADQAIARAMRLVGSHGYYQLCARLAANVWGRPRAGYFSAAEQWRQMLATKNAHPGDRRPPAGALVFWETGGPYGHVAVYLGEGRIVSNDINDDIPGEGGVYLVDFGLIESKWGATYLGWAPPIYSTT